MMPTYDSRLLDFLPDAVIILRANFQVIGANRPAQQLLGANLAGRPLNLVLRHPEALAAIEAVLADEDEERRIEISLPVPVQRHFEMRVAALPEDVSGDAKAIVVLHDVTAARGAEQMRSDFVANVSHELRSPLSSLVGFIQTLSGAARDDPEARERFLGIMESEAGRMTRLIDDLLSLSKVESNEHVPPHGQADIVKLIQGTAETLSMRAADRGMTIGVECNDGPVRVTGDADELTKVIHNLLENAVSYGAPNSNVTIAVKPVERIPVSGLPGIAIVVHNQGETIAPEHLPRLTERFYRVDKARSRSTGGTGLGLAIVKHIVNHHRGQLAFDSAEGEGVTATVYLPTLESGR